MKPKPENGVLLYDPTVERNVIGSIIMEPGCLDEIRSILAPTDFGDATTRILYEVIGKLAEKQNPIDIASIATALTQAGINIGGYDKLTSLIDHTTRPAHASYHAKVIKQYSLRRQLKQVSIDINREADQPTDPDNLQEWAEQRIAKVRDNEPTHSKPLRIYIHETLAELDAFDSGRSERIRTGMNRFDELIALNPDTFIIVAARPGIGKSLLADQVPFFLAKQGHPCAIYSLEMSGEQIASRLLASQANLPIDYIQRRRRGFNQEPQEANVAAEQIADIPLFINDAPWQTIHSIVADARKLRRKNDLKLIVIDYLQLMHAGQKRNQQRYEQLGEISRACKYMSKELKVPVIAAAQLNRESDKGDGRPRVSHLRESGNIEQDADTILLLWPDQTDTNVIRGEVGKNRNGPCGPLSFRFVKHYMRFEEE